MPFIPIPNCARVEVRFIQDGQHVENVFDVGIANTPLPESDALLIEGLFEDWALNLINDYQANNVRATEIYIRDMTTQTSPSYVYPIAGTPGGAPSNPLPNEVSWVCKKNSGIGGRSARGRYYHIGLTQAQVVGNNITTLDANGILSAMNLLRTNCDASNVPLMIASTRHNGVPRTSGILYHVLSFSYSDLTVDRQGRRGPGRGR